ncbi:MAG: decaprenylphospho-beta-D-erythro-pentofuranosid-2-ulose 2-reductase [Actinomycetes bacterium]
MKDSLGGVQTVLVLGGGSEIGLATARRLVADRTRTVILAGRDTEALRSGADELRRLGATQVEVMQFDALHRDSHQSFIDECWSTVGDIDLVLFAFGVLGDQNVAEHDSKEALRIIDSNFIGAVSLLIGSAEKLKAQGHGSIVVLSSVAGERSRRSNFVYGASKAGLDAFSQGLGDSLIGTGVHVLIVRPGFVHTKMTEGLDAAPLSTTPEAVAEAIFDGIAKGREIVWVPAALRGVMSGLRHVPRPLFRRLPI